MASLREIRRKIKSIRSTLSVTKAMKMVAAARLTKAQSRIMDSRPFALRMQKMVEDIDHQTTHCGDKKENKNPFMRGYKSDNGLLVVVTGDKGLCGPFNHNVINKTSDLIEEHKNKEVKIITVGKKCRDYFRRYNYPVVKEYTNIFSRLGFVHAELIGNDIIEYFIKEKCEFVSIVYNGFRNVLKQELKVEGILPVEHEQNPCRESGTGIPFLYEPEAEKIFESLIPRYIKAQVYRILLDSYAAELSARMTAMESATKNAGEIIEFLNLKYNKVRQEQITRELSELVGCAESLQ